MTPDVEATLTQMRERVAADGCQMSMHSTTWCDTHNDRWAPLSPRCFGEHNIDPDRVTLLTAVEAVLAVHAPEGSTWCDECRMHAPCRTVIAVHDAFGN